MPRSMSPARILRAAADAGIIPVDAEISPKGEARWQANALSSVAWLAKDATGGLLWHVNTGDAKFGPALEKFGGLSVPIRSQIDDSLAWPATFSEEFAAVMRSTLGMGAVFVEGRADLCGLLAERHDVARAGVHAWLPTANYPARLVQALILARDIQSADLESITLERLNGPTIELSNGRIMDIMTSAKEWAKRYSKALQVEISI